MEHATSQNWLRTTSFPKNFKEEQKISDWIIEEETLKIG